MIQQMNKKGRRKLKIRSKQKELKVLNGEKNQKRMIEILINSNPWKLNYRLNKANYKN